MIRDKKKTNLGVIYEIYKILLEHYGYQDWWPAETRFEVVVGAILTQNTSWKNAEKAISNLKKENILDEYKLLSVDDDKLKSLIKPAGFYNIKSKRLRDVTKFIVERYGSTEEMAKTKKSTSLLRSELLSIKGIGNETADSILLYALDRRSFVVDAYTKRMFERLGLIDKNCKYDEIKKIFEEALPKDLQIYREYHALIVEHCKTKCKKRPLCNNCPIKKVYICDWKL